MPETPPRAVGRQPRSRLWLATLSLLCFVAALGAAQVSRTLHLALVAHDRCEHGKLVHGDAADDALATATAATQPTDGTAVRSTDSDRDSHEHCGAVAVDPADASSVRAAPNALLLGWELWLAPTGPTEALGAIPLLALAPKQSPPIA